MNRLLFLFVCAGCSDPSIDQTYSSTLSIAFNPMYSAWDGVHTFQVPATITNGSGAAVPTGIKWSASDSSYVDLMPSADGSSVMITTKKAGKVTIIATTADAIGKAPLTITSFTPLEWAKGQARYTSGDMTSLGQQARGSMDKNVQCTSCHGDGPGSLAIEHTPEQTGGFTDDELKNIFLRGQLPAADLEIPLYGGQAQFMSFHQWMVADDDEATGLVCYLRSLAPKDQGALNFGNRGDGGYRNGDGGFRGDGGRGDGGRMRDGGMRDM
jgi:hypothetical protein